VPEIAFFTHAVYSIHLSIGIQAKTAGGKSAGLAACSTFSAVFLFSEIAVTVIS
jgi:hypothetical protein